MSPFPSLFLMLFTLTSFSSCSDEFFPKFKRCADLIFNLAKTGELDNIKDEKLLTEKKLKKCLEVEKCFLDLKKTSDPEDLEQPEVKNMIDTLSSMCEALQVESIDNKAIDCLHKIGFDVLSLEKASSVPLDSKDECRFTAREMYKLGEIIKEKCGIELWRSMKSGMEELRSFPCEKGYKTLIRQFNEVFGEL